jgi:hypothetical protein
LINFFLLGPKTHGARPELIRTNGGPVRLSLAANSHVPKKAGDGEVHHFDLNTKQKAKESIGMVRECLSTRITCSPSRFYLEHSTEDSI